MVRLEKLHPSGTNNLHPFPPASHEIKGATRALKKRSRRMLLALALLVAPANQKRVVADGACFCRSLHSCSVILRLLRDPVLYFITIHVYMPRELNWEQPPWPQ